MLGYTSDEYIGQPISRFHADGTTISNILDRLINNETLINYPAQLQTKGGSVKHVLINSNVLRKDGKFIHTRCFTRDITDLKYEEERKNNFMAMISHELKTPLTSIKSYVQILLARAKVEDDEFRFHTLTRTNIQIKRMVSMIAGFLNLSRLDDANVVLEKEIFDLQFLFRELVADAEILTSQHSIIVSPGETKIYADREKLGHVLMNLLTNAIKYSPNGGNITIGTETVDDKVKVFVSDEGIGIDDEHRDHLFERYYRVKNDAIKNVSGFGLGLYLVAELLRYHDSQIQVTSKVGRGSTFYFLIPAAQS